MNDNDADLAGDVETVLRAVPGVAALHPAGSAASRIVDAGARALGVLAGDPALVALRRAGDRLRVEAAIAVRSDSRAADAARLAHAAVSVLLARRGEGEAEVRLTVVRIESATESDREKGTSS